ncbi:MAG: cytochrome c3 family protein [Deltaproteobacteria bacterium]
MRSNRNFILILIGFSLVLLFGGIGFIYSGQVSQQTPQDGPRLPLILAYKGKAKALERPEVSFDHDMHTKALKQTKMDDCKVCHVIEETDKNLVIQKRVTVFRFPKQRVDWNDKTAIMEAFHAQCGDCHRKRNREGKKSGPDIPEVEITSQQGLPNSPCTISPCPGDCYRCRVGPRHQMGRQGMPNLSSTL